MGLVLERKPEHETLRFSRVKWLQPAMNVSTRNRFLHCVLQRAGANRIVMAAWMCTWCCKTQCAGCLNVAWALHGHCMGFAWACNNLGQE